jgi:hypothetical protein
VSFAERSYDCLFLTITATTGTGLLLMVGSKHVFSISVGVFMLMFPLNLAAWLGYPLLSDLFGMARRRLKKIKLQQEKRYIPYTKVWIISIAIVFALVIGGIYVLHFALYSPDQTSITYMDASESFFHRIPNPIEAIISTIDMLNPQSVYYHAPYLSHLWFLVMLLYLAGSPVGGTGGGLKFPVFYSLGLVFKKNKTAEQKIYSAVFFRLLRWMAIIDLLIGLLLIGYHAPSSYYLLMNLSSFANSGVIHSNNTGIQCIIVFLLLFGRVALPALTYYYWQSLNEPYKETLPIQEGTVQSL